VPRLGWLALPGRRRGAAGEGHECARGSPGAVSRYRAGTAGYCVISRDLIV
jgi:hypothetical protein